LLTNRPKKRECNTTLGREKHSSLFGPFVSYGEKKFCENCPFDTLGALRQKQIPLAETIFFFKNISNFQLDAVLNLFLTLGHFEPPFKRLGHDSANINNTGYFLLTKRIIIQALTHLFNSSFYKDCLNMLK